MQQLSRLHPNVRRFFSLLRSPRRAGGFRTVAQWRALTNAFARWPSKRVAQSDCTTWVSCVRCKRASPRAVMRNWCFHCSNGEAWLYGAAVEREHAGSFECGSWDAARWWEPLGSSYVLLRERARALQVSP